MKKKFVTSLALAVMGTAMMAGSAMATSVLTVWDGTTLLTVADNDSSGYDRDSTIGIIDTSWKHGLWTLNVNIGTSKPIVGSAFVPTIDLYNVQTSSAAAGTLVISFSDINFGPLASSLTGFLTAAGGTTNGAVNVKSYYDAANTLFGKGTLMANMSFAPISFSGETEFYGIPNLLDPSFSLTLVTTVTHAGKGITSMDASVSPIPEPATMLLFGTGLVGLAGVARRRLAKKA